MRNNKKWPFIAIGLSLLLFTACTQQSETDNTEPPKQNNEQNNTDDNSNEQSDTPQQGGTVRIGLLNNVKIDLLGLEKDEFPLPVVYRGLLKWDETHKAIPDIAKEYKVDEAAKTIMISLTDSLKWHDGTAITPQDVLFTLETYAHPYYYGIWRDGFESIAGVSEYRSFRKDTLLGVTLDEATGIITIQLTELNPEVENLLTAPLLPQHVLKGKKIEEINQLALEGKVPGNGSYQIKNVAENEIVLSKSNGANAYLDELVFSYVGEEEVKASNEGNFDIIQGSPMTLKALESNDTWTVLSNPGLGYHYLGINNGNELFKNNKVRNALASIIDKESYIKDVLSGNGVGAISPIPPESWAFNMELKSPQPSIEQAKQMLTDAGWDFTKEISLRYVKDDPMWESAAKWTEARFTQAGIKLKLEPMEANQFVPYLFSGQPYDLFLYAWKDEADLVHLNEQWMSNEIDQGLNVVAYSNLASDQLIGKAATTFDLETRKQAYDQWQQAFISDSPIIPIARPAQLFIVSEKVNGVATGFNVDQWWKSE